MIKYFAKSKTFILITSLVFFTSYYGQVKTNMPTDSVGIKKTTTNGYLKIIKAQGLSEYNHVRCGLRDKSGNLWFGTTGKGVYRYDGNLFTQYTEKDGLSGNSIGSILEDKNGNLWFGTNNGACRYDGKQFTTIPFTNKNDKNKISKKNTNASSSARIGVSSMMQSKTGKLWFCTNDGVYCYDGKTFSLFLDNDSVVNSGKLHLRNIESIMEDKKGNIWFGSYNGENICLYDGKYLTQPFLLNPNVRKRVMSILEDKNGIIWFGTGSGTFYYDGKTLNNVAEKAAVNWAYTIFEDRNGNLWFATEDGGGQRDEPGGVWRFDGKSFTKFTTKDGLIHNGVFCAVEDKDGNLWFGTRYMGLCKYDGKTFTNFSE